MNCIICFNIVKQLTKNLRGDETLMPVAYSLERRRIQRIASTLYRDEASPLYNSSPQMEQYLAIEIRIAPLIKNKELLGYYFSKLSDIDENDAIIYRILRNALEALALVFEKEWKDVYKREILIDGLWRAFPVLMKNGIRRKDFRKLYFIESLMQSNREKIHQIINKPGLLKARRIGKLIIEGNSG